MAIRIFYDGYCPLCLAEMNKLKAYDKDHNIEFVDIQLASFTKDYPSLNWHDLNARIHVQKMNGEMVTGLDATYLAWDTIGKGWLYGRMRWPIIRWFADGFYAFFARHRYTISYVLTGKKRCDTCAVSATTKDSVKSKGEDK